MSATRQNCSQGRENEGRYILEPGILVAIPLPFTGAWTGAGIAALFEMRFRNAMLAVTLGVLIADAVDRDHLRRAWFLNFLRSRMLVQYRKSGEGGPFMKTSRLRHTYPRTNACP